MEKFITKYNNVEELLNDGMDVEVLNEKHYVYGHKEMIPSEIKGAFTLIEVIGADDTPIFLEEDSHMIDEYMND